MRRIKFQKAVLRGPEYVCSSCHRTLFKKSVTAVSEKLKNKIKVASKERVDQLTEQQRKAQNKASKLMKKPFQFVEDAYKTWNHPSNLVTSIGNDTYLCSSCKNALKKGNIPAMAAANGLQLNHPDRPVLTELENNMIAYNINFQKFVLLQKSRWAAGKGRMICVPVGPADIMNTVKQLPRLPDEAGLVPIKLKRKKVYKTHEKQEQIRPEKIFAALKYLNHAGHPYYKFYDSEDTYKARLKAKEIQLLYNEDNIDDLEEEVGKLATENCVDAELEDEAVRESEEEDEEGEDDMEAALEAEEEDIQDDPVRRQHFNYSEYSTLVNGHPEIFLDNNGNQITNLDFAPGEGKKPVNFLDQKDWDIKSWPTLLPDGKFGLNHKRRVKLTHQNYFQQRILNVDERFAKTPGYIFGAMSLIEAERLRSNANLTGVKGKRTAGPDGSFTYTLEDPCSVFEKVKGTPKYWQRAKYDIIAKLENIGPFHIFFTLTSGDNRWSANFTPVLEKLNCKMQYKVDPEGREQVTVEVKQGNSIVQLPWKQYLDKYVDRSQHELIRRNVLLATRNFQHRVETFRKEVIFGRNNPMNVRHISYRVEFQGRGAGHIHGVLWLDLKEMRIENVRNEDLQKGYNMLRHNKALEPEQITAIENFTDAFVTCTRCVSMASEEAVKKAEEVNWHNHSKSCKKGGSPVCRWKFPRYPLERTEFVDAHEDKGEDFIPMPMEERNDILERVMEVLVEEEGGRMVLSQKVKEIMIGYENVKVIRAEKDGEVVNLSTFSENEATFSDSPNNNLKQGRLSTFSDDTETFSEGIKQTGKHGKSKKRTKKSVSNGTDTEEPPPKKAKIKTDPISYIKMESPEEYKKNIGERIKKVLKIASVGRKEPITYYQYWRAVVEQPRKGSEVLLRRDIDEIFINNYNPEWIVTWDANIDVSPVYDYYGTITYITDYFTKDSTGLTDVLKTAMKQLGNDMDMREKCHKMADMFMTHRQVGEQECFFKLFAHMNLVYSSIATVFVPTDPKGYRRQFLQRQDPESGEGFKVDDKEGLFLEKPDLISKYERRKLVREGEEDPDNEDSAVLDQMSFCQFVKMYSSKGWQQKEQPNEEGEMEENQDEDVPDEGELADEDDLNYLIVGHTAERRLLPEMLTLENPVKGEPRFLHKRTFPRALRYFKKKLDMDPHRYYLAELMLYRPFRDENELFPEDPLKCQELYLQNVDEIKIVKAKLMPFLESVEEAQLIYEEMKAQEALDVQKEMGADLDPEKEQEIADLDDEDDEEHPDYYHIDADQVEENPPSDGRTRPVFKTIKLPSKHVQVEEARKLDKMQKVVLSIGLFYAKRLVTCTASASRKPSSSSTFSDSASTFSDSNFSHPIPATFSVPTTTFSENNYNFIKPTPPLVIVHGGAGSGKSRVINSLYNMMTDILKQPGDDPNYPYVVLTSFTGAASANINGQTLHSLFGFKFGTTFLSMSEMQRANKRILFQNLKCVIVDEISMVSADLFYNLDLRLREITGVMDTVFGGVSVFVFGDLFQLQPPRARYVFQEPKNTEHSVVFSIRNLWRLFTVVNLEENHRQGEDKAYGDLLNRVRIGLHTEADIDLLKTRVRPNTDPSLDDGIHTYGTNAKVNARNNAKIGQMEGELFTIKAKNASRTVKKFKVNNAGCIKNTPFQAKLELKIGAEVVLVHNINTLDGLTNGCRGVLVDVEKKGNSIHRLAIKFHNPDHGRLQREKDPNKKYPEATYIYPVFWQYFIGGATATVFQFPVKGAAAITSHKLQGQTVPEPNSLVVDVVSAHQPGMVYVMLSRVCSLQQLSILDKFDPEKISVNENVIAEAKRMSRVAINNNPCNWMNPKSPGLKVCSLNVSSLRRHIEDVRSDPVLLQSDILCLQEIWLEPGEERESQYQLEGFTGHFTCVGAGKGIAVYVKDGKVNGTYHGFEQPLCQFGKVSLKNLDIINMYRSSGEPFDRVAHHLKEFIDLEKTTLVIGDLNYCAAKDSNQLSRFFYDQKFQQLVDLPTHIAGGIFIHFVHITIVEVYFHRDRMSPNLSIKYCTTELISYLQVSSTRHTCASPRGTRRMPRRPPTHTTSVIMTVSM